MDAQTVGKIEQLVTAGLGRIVESGGRSFSFVPAGYDLEELQPLERPVGSYIQQTVRIDTKTSFSDYVNAYKGANTRIFFNRTSRTFSAVFDYHSSLLEVGRCAHRAAYSCPHSDEWNAWTALDGKQIAQRDFAEFVEDHVGDVIRPEAAALLEIAQRLQISRKVNFVSAKNLGSGTVEFQYTEEDEAKAGKQNIQVPTDIELAIPVFRGEDRYKIAAKFRYRLDDGKLFFVVKILQREAILDDALSQMIEAISAETRLSIIHGSLA
jgi:uncharacterized protein YfdQ (DUF2303 family)